MKRRDVASGTIAADDPVVLDRRRAGVLLHPTSLPSGQFDADALRFMDWLQAGGFSVWQMLPLGPVGLHASPYSPDSAFAGNTLLFPSREDAEPIAPVELDHFRRGAVYWLEDFALFRAIRQARSGQPWWEWPEGLRRRHPAALNAAAHEHAADISSCIAEQFRFERAWLALRGEAARRGILLYGDLPMFVVADSADVWAHPELFRLDDHGHATHVAGVPPDAFTDLGQCWDNPVFDWDSMLAQDFEWWRHRLAHECRRFDVLRWDHFRGLEATWEIPVTANAGPGRAKAGAWREVPGEALLNCLVDTLGSLPLIAENLGVITPGVEALRKRFRLPGMHVLQFAFDGTAANPHLPRHHEVQGVVYTGTHDNDTSRGWWESLTVEAREAVRETLHSEEAMPDALIHAALASRSRLCVIPLQDLLGLGSEARMNTPGRANGQWRWQFSWQQLADSGTALWRQALSESGRT